MWFLQVSYEFLTSHCFLQALVNVLEIISIIQIIPKRMFQINSTVMVLLFRRWILKTLNLHEK